MVHLVCGSAAIKVEDLDVGGRVAGVVAGEGEAGGVAGRQRLLGVVLAVQQGEQAGPRPAQQGEPVLPAK